MYRLFTAALLLVVLPAAASAHPGHGATAPDTLTHYAFEPAHWLPVAGILAVGGVLAAVRYLQRSR